MTISTINTTLSSTIRPFQQKLPPWIIAIVLAYLGNWKPLEIPQYSQLFASIQRILLADYIGQPIPLSPAEKTAMSTAVTVESAPPFQQLICAIERSHQLPVVPREDRFNLQYRFTLADQRQAFIDQLKTGTVDSIPEQWMNDEHVLLAAADYSITYLSQFSPKLFLKRDLMIQLVSHNGMALRYVHPSLRDAQMSEIAVSNSGGAIQFVPCNIPNYEEIALKAITTDAFAINLIPSSLSRNPQFKEKAKPLNPRVADFI